MKEHNWNDCLEKFTSKKVTPDLKRAQSLSETARQRIALVQKITAENCNFVFEDYYTSLLELLQARSFEQGYNILNHVCLGYYLRDVLKEEQLFTLFDDLRFKRNSLIYYGKRMESAIANDAIEKCKKIIDAL